MWWISEAHTCLHCSAVQCLCCDTLCQSQGHFSSFYVLSRMYVTVYKWSNAFLILHSCLLSTVAKQRSEVHIVHNLPLSFLSFFEQQNLQLCPLRRVCLVAKPGCQALGCLLLPTLTFGPLTSSLAFSTSSWSCVFSILHSQAMRSILKESFLKIMSCFHACAPSIRKKTLKSE